MAKFEIFIDELVNHQHRFVVEAESEEQVEEALDYADDCGENTADDYGYRLREKLKVLEHDDEYFVDVKEIEFNDFSELSLEEDESEDEI